MAYERNPQTLEEFIEVAEKILANPDAISFAKAPGTSWGGPVFLLHMLTTVAKELRRPPPGADDR